MLFYKGDGVEYAEGLSKNGYYVILAHGCNLSGGFGSGIAGKIKEKFPFVADAYYNYSKFYRLGEIMPVMVDDHFIIYNCFTQERYGRNKNIKYASLEAISSCMLKVAIDSKNLNYDTVVIPRIGCGNGGLDWEEVKDVLMEIEVECDMKFNVNG